MRKIATLTMVATAALLVTACGKTENTNVTETNAMVTDMNATDAMEGTTNDTMTNGDAAMGSSDNMMAGNDAMMSSNMSDNAMGTNASNAM